MPKEGIARVRALTRKLPDVEEGTTFGFPAFKVGGKTFASFPKKKEVESGHEYIVTQAKGSAIRRRPRR